jgi:hypothetical protein
MKIDKLSTHDDFKKLCYEYPDNKYFKPAQYNIRWSYYSIVFDMLNNEVDTINTSIEVGSEGFLMIKDSEVFQGDLRNLNFRDQISRGELETKQPRWPFEDKQFDMFIALEVWEHLWNINMPVEVISKKKYGAVKRMEKYGVERPNPQASVFKEVMRVSKNAILSFPYMWGEHNSCTSANPHYQIDREIIKGWTCGVEPIEIVDGHNDHKDGIRTVYRWKF